MAREKKSITGNRVELSTKRRLRRPNLFIISALRDAPESSCYINGSDRPHRRRRIDQSVVFARWCHCQCAFCLIHGSHGSTQFCLPAKGHLDRFRRFCRVSTSTHHTRCDSHTHYAADSDTLCRSSYTQRIVCTSLAADFDGAHDRSVSDAFTCNVLFAGRRQKNNMALNGAFVTRTTKTHGPTTDTIISK